MDKKRFPIGMQLGLIFTVTFALFLSLIVFCLWQFKENVNETDSLGTHTMARSMLIKDAANEFSRALLDMRGFLLYPDAKYEVGFRDNFAHAIDKVTQYNNTSTQSDTKEEGTKLAKMLAEYQLLGNKVIAAKKLGDPSLPSLMEQGRQLVADIDAQFVKLSKIQADYLRNKTKLLNNQAGRDIEIIAGIAVFVVILAGGMAFWFSRNTTARIRRVSGDLATIGRLDLTGHDVQPTRNDEIGDMGIVVINMKKALKTFVHQLQDGADSLAASSQELSATVEENFKASEGVSKSVADIATGVAHNSDSVANISATLQQLSAGTQEMSAGSAEVNNNTQNAVHEISSGMLMLENLAQQNADIAVAMGSITEATEELDKGSQEIQGIVGVISNIASQTNLLALNAAIEAARAGDAGRGFAVVADEVRRLAEQSAKATEDISNIISTMSQEIGRSVSVVTTANNQVIAGKRAAEETREGFKTIVAKLEDVRAGIQQISQAVNETAKGTENMVGSVETISSVAQKTSEQAANVAATSEEQTASMHEISSHADTLSQLAVELDNTARKFLV